MLFNAAIAAGALATTVAAHGYVTQVTADGVVNRGYLLDDYYSKINTGSYPASVGWYAENLDSGFIEPNSAGTVNVVCHKNSAAAGKAAVVKAGGSLTFQWNTWPAGHVGPIIDYLAPVGTNFASAKAADLKFLKIQATGYSGGKWATDTLVGGGFKWTTRIPSYVKPGYYVLRHEIIALHGGPNANGAQLYPQCITIQVTGSGTDAMSGGVSATTFYKATDPGILFQTYNTPINYPIPGPALYKAGQTKRHAKDIEQ